MAQTRPLHLHLVPCARVAVLAVAGGLPRLAVSAVAVAAMVNFPLPVLAILRLAGRDFPRRAATATVAGFVPAAVVVVVDKLLLVLLRKTAATVARRLRSLILHRIPLAAARLAERLAGTDPTAAPRTTMLSAAMVVVVDPLRRLARQAMAAMAAILAVAGVVVVPEPQMPRALAEPAAMALSG
jgi:hypothetical protein